MNATQAALRLARMLQADVKPELSLVEQADLLEMCKLADSAGLAPSDAAWEPTWDLNRGAAEGWRWKAAKVASAFDYSADGGNYQRSQMAQMCREQAALYTRRILPVSVPIRSPLTGNVTEFDYDLVEEDDEC